MQVENSIMMNADIDKIWSAMTDFHNCADYISDIEKIEVLDEGDDNLIGYKWRETRTMFGKQSTETIWITHAEKHQYYQTRAENHGAIYIAKFTFEQKDDGVLVKMSFGAEAVSLFAKIMMKLTANMVKKSLMKVMMQDLTDIKNHVEKA